MQWNMDAFREKTDMAHIVQTQKGTYNTKSSLDATSSEPISLNIHNCSIVQLHLLTFCFY